MTRMRSDSWEPHGRGSHEYNQVLGRIDILTGTLGKALGGASGGYTSGRKEIIELFRQRSRPYLFSNTLAPSIAGASLKVLEMLTRSTELRDNLRRTRSFFATGWKSSGLRFCRGRTRLCRSCLGTRRWPDGSRRRCWSTVFMSLGFPTRWCRKEKREFARKFLQLTTPGSEALAASNGKTRLLASARSFARGQKRAPEFDTNSTCLHFITMIRLLPAKQNPTPPVPMQTSTEIGYNSKVEGDVVVTRVDAALNWFRKNSLWPMPMGLACCAIELMAAGASRFDISRFGSEVMRFSPRQSDVMIVAGTVTYKMALAVKRIYDQMAEPKWVIAMGACASTGGMYRSYAVLQGVDQHYCRWMFMWPVVRRGPRRCWTR